MTFHHPRYREYLNFVARWRMELWLSPAMLSQTCSRPEKNPLNPVLICVCASSTKKSFPSNGHCSILLTSGICCRGTNEPSERVGISCSGFDCLQCMAALGESSLSVPQFPHRARDLFPPGSEFHWNTRPLGIFSKQFHHFSSNQCTSGRA